MADSEGVLTVRPRLIRIMVWIAAPVTLVLFTAIAFSLNGSFNETGAAFETPDQVAMILLGVLVAAGSLILARPSLTADANGVRVRNLIGSVDLPWPVIRAIRFNRGAAWVTLDLHDDDVVSVLAIQAADKEHAVRAVRALRAMHHASQAAATSGRE